MYVQFKNNYMKIEIYKNDELLNVEYLSVTRLENAVFQLGENLNRIGNIDFSSIRNLIGNEILLEKAFNDQLLEEKNN